MKIKEPEKEILNDFEHQVTRKIAMYSDRPDFPCLDDYGIDKMEFDGYLFDKQAILDMGGSQQSKLTVGGIITVLPVIVLAALPNSCYVFGMLWTTVVAIVIGLMLCFFLYAILQAVIHLRLSRQKNSKMETYIKAVLFYQPAL